MSKRALAWCALTLALTAVAATAATIERAEELYLAGDLEDASSELQELLADADGDSPRAAALLLLGRVAVDREDWSGALAAWGELTDRHALSEQTASIAAAIRPLQALAECGCTGAGPAPAAEPTAAPVAVERAEGLLLVGGWGAEFEAAEEVTQDLIAFLEANGVSVRAASTEATAIRGEETVLAALLAEGAAAGADGVIFITTRFNFREFIMVRRFDTNGVQIWRDRFTGGTALKERRDRDKPSWHLVDRAKKSLSKRLGTPDLPTDGG